MRTTLTFPALAATLALGACGPKISMTDDIDLTWDFGLTLARFDDDLHTPYVKGAPVRLYIDSDSDDTDMTGWTVVSSRPEVFRIDGITLDADRHGLTAAGVAAGEGQSVLTVYDRDGDEVGDGLAEVAAPDRVELQAHGYLIIGRGGEAYVGEARQLQGGTATYLVRYLRGDRELHGNGVLGALVPDGIEATPRTTFLFENREWLTLTSSKLGLAPITLTADGDTVATVNVTTVPETDVDHVDILGMNEKGRDQGEPLVALAQAYDAMGRRLFGVDFTWTLGGVDQVGEGDLFRYDFEPGQYQMLTAERGGQAGAAMIHAGEGYVDSSNNLGCRALPGRGRAGAPGLALAGLALVGLSLARGRRRRA